MSVNFAVTYNTSGGRRGRGGWLDGNLQLRDRSATLFNSAGRVIHECTVTRELQEILFSGRGTEIQWEQTSGRVVYVEVSRTSPPTTEEPRWRQSTSYRVLHPQPRPETRSRSPVERRQQGTTPRLVPGPPVSWGAFETPVQHPRTHEHHGSATRLDTTALPTLLDTTARQDDISFLMQRRRGESVDPTRPHPRQAIQSLRQMTVAGVQWDGVSLIPASSSSVFAHSAVPGMPMAHTQTRYGFIGWVNVKTQQAWITTGSDESDVLVLPRENVDQAGLLPGKGACVSFALGGASGTLAVRWRLCPLDEVEGLQILGVAPSALAGSPAHATCKFFNGQYGFTLCNRYIEAAKFNGCPACYIPPSIQRGTALKLWVDGAWSVAST